MSRRPFLLVAFALLAACRPAPDGNAAYEKARHYYDQQEFAKARIELMNALSANPKDGRAHLLMGENLLALGDGPGAEMALRRATTNGIDARKVHYPLIASYLLQGQDAKAMDLLEENADPAQAPVEHFLLLGRALLQRGDVAGAQRAIEQGLARFPEHDGLLIARGRAALVAGDAATAKSFSERALAKAPKDPQALALALDVARVSGEAGAEASAASALSAAARGNPASDLHAAQEKLRANNPAGAERIIDGLLAAQPGNADAQRLKLAVLARTKRYPDIIAYAEKGDRTLRETAIYAYAQGSVAAQQGLKDLAVERFQTAVRRSPEDRPARYALAEAHLANGDEAGARAALAPIGQPADLPAALRPYARAGAASVARPAADRP